MRFAWVIALCLVPELAWAHAFGKSFLDVKPVPEGVSVIFDIDPDDLEETLRRRFDDDGSGVIDAAEMQAHLDTLTEIQRVGLVVTQSDLRCEGALQDKRVSQEAMMVRARLLYTCATGPLGLDLPLLERLKPGHAALVTLRFPSGVQGLVLDGTSPSYSQEGPSVWRSVGRFFVFGVEHIVTGYDHLLFLLALLLVARGLTDIVRIVTSFTVAHSLTLVAAATGAVSLPASIVEPGIALSIAYVGAENLWVKKTDHRLWLTFALGLVHGFGFAGLLSEMGLPERGRVASLLSFNLGVEAGQVVIVLLLVPLLALVKRRPMHARLVQVGSAMIIVMGLFWFLERVLGS